MTYIIAEIGSTHDGSIGNALRMVETFAELGADAVKFQCHTGQVVPDEKHPSVRVLSESRRAYYERTAFDAEQWWGLATAAKGCGVDFIVSPFSVQAVELLADLVDAWKIASGEVTNTALLEAVAATGKPVHVSSGMTSDDETWKAVEVFTRSRSLASVMLCTSQYPCAPENVCLQTLTRWKLTREWDPPQYRWGFSDHTMGMAASLAAITLGATVIERHVTLSRRMYGSDAAHSLEPDEFARFVREVRELDRMLASPVDKDELVNTPEIRRMREVFLCRG